jgi:RimJ/RimL family protein N-acetyltransferase
VRGAPSLKAIGDRLSALVGVRSTTLVTKRCVLRPVSPGDTAQLHGVWSSPGVRRFLWDDEIIPIAQTRAAIDQSQSMFDEQARGLWGAWLSASPTLVGFGGLWPFRDPPELELLYGVREQLWGQGYAVEVAHAVMAYCFDSLDMPVIRASTDVANRASVRVLDKLGFRCVHRSTVAGLDTVFYEIRRGC